ncbi:11051_t:CDS:2, partial [Paraglomus brasilianum]
MSPPKKQLEFVHEVQKVFKDSKFLLTDNNQRYRIVTLEFYSLLFITIINSSGLPLFFSFVLIRTFEKQRPRQAQRRVTKAARAPEANKIVIPSLSPARLNVQQHRARKPSFSVSKTDLLLETLREEQVSSSQKAAREFIEQTLEVKLLGSNLHESLKDGVVLCSLMNRLKPKSIPQISRKNLPFVKMENIHNFLNAARQFGLHNSDLFETVDLFEGKDMERVVATILALARIAAGKYTCRRSDISTEKHNTKEQRKFKENTDQPNKMENQLPSSRGAISNSDISRRARGDSRRLTQPPTDGDQVILDAVKKARRHSLADTKFRMERTLNERFISERTIAEAEWTLPQQNSVTNGQLERNSSAPELFSMDQNLTNEETNLQKKRPSLRKVVTMGQLFTKVNENDQDESEFIGEQIPPLPSSPSVEKSENDNGLKMPRRSSHIKTHVRYKSDRTAEISFNKNDRIMAFPEVRSRRESLVGTSLLTDIRDREKLVLMEDGQIMAQYQLGNCIGKGQFGAVYRALHLGTGQMVAVKRIKLDGRKDEEIQQLMQEVELLKSLSHPSVVKYEAYIMTEDYINIILEYAENGSLLNTLKSFGNFPEKLVASYVVKILEGLSYLHNKHVVHCDLKAANILTTKNGNVKLSDFGVSLNLKMMEKVNTDVAGTPNWMAPEVIELKGASTASDIWSLGCTIIELLTGKPPYADLMAMTTLFRIVEDECPPIPSTISSELDDFLRLCFRKNSAARPTANELFKHPWILNNWSLRELRPQDSLPFIRRITSENNIPDMSSLTNSATINPNNQLDESGIDMDPRISYYNPVLFAASPPISPVGSPITTPHLAFAPPQPQTKMYVATPLVPHRFVKNSFSKPVECRICHHTMKTKAVMCEECNMVCHSKCQGEAPFPCSLPNRKIMYTSLGL